MNGSLQVEHIINALRELEGEASFNEIYELVTKKRGGGFGHYRGVKSYRPTMWQLIYQHCKGSAKYREGPEYFRRVGGRSHSRHSRIRLVDSLFEQASKLPPSVLTIKAEDVGEPPPRVLSQTYRVLRDTELARRIKAIHNCKCQICHHEGLQLSDGRRYAEAHHIQPLGTSHSGPDVSGNIICVCPNCHVLLDYGAIRLDIAQMDSSPHHQVATKYSDYHNEKLFGKVTVLI